MTWSDLFTWAFYLCAMAALLLMVHARAAGFSRQVALDAVVVTLGAASLVTSFLLPPLLAANVDAPRRTLVALSFPAADLLMLALFVGALSLFHWRPPVAFVWLAAGFAVFGLADCAYIFHSDFGLIGTSGPNDALRMAAVTVVALAPGRSGLVGSGGRSAVWVPIAAPLVAATIATCVLFAERFTVIHPAAIYLALCTIVAALCRLAFAFLESRRTADYALAATTDHLTQLLNRRGFYERAAPRVEHPMQFGGPPARCALLLLDLDHFKDVNDSLGHATGDHLLQHVARRLTEQLDPATLLARLGGDEFAALLPGAGVQQAEQAARDVMAALSKPLALDGMHVQTRASIGIALSPDHCHDIGSLLRYADIAMYHAKMRQCGFTVFDHEVHEELTSRARMELLSQLRQAIETRELTVVYQPQVRLSDGRVVGVEALVRWEHPERGLLLPHQFLPLARHHNMMQGLTEVVVELVLQDSAHWQRLGYSLPVAINLPPSAFADTDLPLRVAAALHRHAVEAGSLAVEITEDFVLANRDLARSVLTRLRDMGVRISIDDFGSGQTSLHYLRELPIHEVKLDRSFTAAITTDPISAAIVRSVIDVSRALGLTVVAEGVENHTHTAALSRCGCHVVQGHYYSPPVAAAELLRWIDGRTATHSA